MTIAPPRTRVGATVVGSSRAAVSCGGVPWDQARRTLSAVPMGRIRACSASGSGSATGRPAAVRPSAKVSGTVSGKVSGAAPGNA